MIAPQDLPIASVAVNSGSVDASGTGHKIVGTQTRLNSRVVYCGWCALLATALLVTAGCSEADDDEHHVQNETSSLAAFGTSGSTATNGNVSLGIGPPAGCFYAFKDSGGVFTSTGNRPHLELWVASGGEPYEYIDYERYTLGDTTVVFDLCAVEVLPPGDYVAELRVFPDMDFPIGGEWEECESGWLDRNEVCTVARGLEFRVVETPTVLEVANLSDRLHGNCGGGRGTSKHLCTGWVDVGSGVYQFRYDCGRLSEGSVKLMTQASVDSGGFRTTFEIRTPDGNTFSVPSVTSSPDENGRTTWTDHLDYHVGSVVETSTCIAEVMVEGEARIKLQVKGDLDSDLDETLCYEFKLDTEHISQENDWSCGVQNIRMWLSHSGIDRTEDEIADSYTGAETGTSVPEMIDALSSETGLVFAETGFLDQHAAAKNIAKLIEVWQKPVVVVGTFRATGKHWYSITGFRACADPGVSASAIIGYPDLSITHFYVSDSVWGSEYYGEQELAVPFDEAVAVEGFMDAHVEAVGCPSWDIWCTDRYVIIHRHHSASPSQDERQPFHNDEEYASY